MSKNNVVIMDFFATWCSPCKMQHTVMEELKKKFIGDVIFKEIDVDMNREIARKYDIHAMPTIIIEKGGKTFKRYVGLTRTKTLEDDINNAIKQDTKHENDEKQQIY